MSSEKSLTHQSRSSELAETLTAAPSPEALRQAAMLNGLRTRMAVVSGALFGFERAL